ncbi:MAG: hypothetical protein ACR2RV_06990 [Verrucomicrobiales bacterium]
MPLVIILASAASMLSLSAAAAQSPAAGGEPKPPSSWEELGFDDAPEGYPTEQIPLFDGLNKSRGTWVFEGSLSDTDTATPLEGKMQIMGGFKGVMVPMWRMDLGWPGEEPEQMISYMLMASPETGGFELMLVQIGPVAPGSEGKPPKTVFKGTSEPGARTITWKEMAVAGQPAAGAGSPESFSMAIAANGQITIPSPEGAAPPQRLAGKTVSRIGKPYVEEKTSERTEFETYADVSNPRVKRCLPPGAEKITLRAERAGHFARYKVSEEGFHKYLNELWEKNGATSAHQRDQMHGEGEPADQDKLAERLEVLGWEPLKNAVIYYSPSKASGAMTTYYYDREAGTAFHDTGYW